MNTNLVERSIKSQKNIKKNKILTISFEDYYQNPDKNISNICKFINTRPSKYTKSEISFHQYNQLNLMLTH